MKPLVTMRQALTDPQLLGGALPGDSWRIWRTLLIAAMGEPLTDDEREAFAAVTGRPEEPHQRVDEMWCVVGRRAGKTRAAGALAAYSSALCDWTDRLAPGERGVFPILAASTSQADRAYQHAIGILQHSPVLRGQIIGDPTSETIRLSSRVDITIKPANFRTIRGITAVGAVCDELAFWHIEGSRNPDREILAALRPALITTGGPLLVISSPYARRGELYRTYKADFGPEGDPSILVAKGPSRVFNSTLPQAEIDKAFARDPASASAEYGAEFRVDCEMLFDRETVELAVDLNTTVRAFNPGVRYKAFIDPSGGSADSMTLAIGHKEGTKAVIDLVLEEKPPYSPEFVTDKFANTLRTYGITRVVGDRFGGEWCREPFQRRGITYAISPAPKSELYLALLPALNSGRVALIDNDRLIDQLVGLERRTSSSGRDSVDSPPGGHEDVANAVAGVVYLLLQQREAPVAYTTTYHHGGLPTPYDLLDKLLAQ
ncbi:hypothetical protein GCM10007881_15980 [Mesorhizobium huakuii]|uniref:hypothetical protein n=1 Tax=Mesorhizobium huakuii TaxID=28104 RepID=UPI00235D6FD8|nr:hypothetical protein [Mesorhizobium huakuii]GLQ78082.1 hypothetical protein GCM10007881_15980 [Mesorhizobium huakuii]